MLAKWNDSCIIILIYHNNITITVKIPNSNNIISDTRGQAFIQGRIQDLRKVGAHSQVLSRDFFSQPRPLIAHARVPRGYYCYIVQ